MSEQTEIRLGVSQGVDWRLIVTEIGQDNVLISLEQPASETHFGAIHGYQQRTVHQAIVVPVEHRAAVALALLGGITDEMIERGAAAIWKPGLWEGHKIDQIDKELSRQDARHVLEAVFGVAIGGGGEG